MALVQLRYSADTLKKLKTYLNDQDSDTFLSIQTSNKLPEELDPSVQTLVLEDVTYRYPSQKTDTLKNVNITSVQASVMGSMASQVLVRRP